MFNLDPGKLIVIAVVAIILLGPDKLPQVARQIGGAWRSFGEFRHRMEAEVRSTMPDLPPTSEIARLARSPSALLHHLSTMSDGDEDEAPDGSFQPPGAADGMAEDESASAQAPAPAPAPADGAGPPTADGPGVVPPPPAADGVAPPTSPPRTASAVPSPAPEVVVPGDPTLN